MNRPTNINKFSNCFKEKVKSISTCYNHTLAITGNNLSFHSFTKITCQS